MRRFALGRISRPVLGVLAISAGTLAGQLVIALATPILSRMYSPEVFGAYSAVLAVASAIGPAAALKYDSAILLPKRDADARGVLILALLSATGVAAVTGGAMWLVGPVVFAEAWTAVPFASVWVALLVLATGVFTCLVQAVLRTKAYGTVGWRATIQSVGISSAQIGLGAISPTAGNLIGGALLGRLLGFGALIRGAKPLFLAEKGDSLRRLALHYWRSPVVLAPSSLMNAVGTQLPLVILAAWFGSEIAGQMGMAQRLVFLPSALLGAAVGQVFGAEVAHRLREGIGNSRRLYLSSSLKMTGLAIAICVGILTLAPIVLPWLLGSQWHVSGQLAQAMAVSAGLGLVASPLSRVYSVHQSRASLLVDLSRIVFVATAAWFAWVADMDAIETTWTLYAGQALNYLLTWAYGLRIVSRKH